MKPLFPTLYLALAALCLSPVSPAQAQSGILLKTFDNLKAGKLLLDPNRPRLYATLPFDNSLAVIDTNTNTVVTTFFIGANPSSLSISPDGTRLYVANSGSTSAAIGVVDLTTLTTLTSLPTPGTTSAVAAGLGNRVYALTAGVNGNGIIAQIDGTTGTLETTIGDGSVQATGSFKITPDGTRLFSAVTGGTAAYDVSTATPTLLQAVSDVGGGGQLFDISRDSLYLVGLGTGTTSSLVSTGDLSRVLGSFNVGSYVGPAVFSPDGTLVYEVQDYGGSNGQSAFKIFSTATFTQLDSFLDPSPGASSGQAPTISGLAVTQPDGYLYLAAAGGFYGANNLEIISTQRAPFFGGSVALSDGFYYLKFSDGVPFGYYNFNFSPYLFHSDLGFEYPFDAADGSAGVYLYDFTAQTFFYTSRSLFPYLYDFTLNTFLYYFPDPTRPDHYNTDGTRYFYNFATGEVISK